MLLDCGDREQELRAHIHSLLSQYATAHLATDHVLWTETGVANALSECLHPIPMTERTAVALPLDPLEVLSQQLNLPKIDIFEERWKVPDKDAVLYLKQQISALHGRAESADRHWRSNHDDDYDAFLLRRPMSPVLSSRARRETPHIGHGTFVARLPHSNEQLVQYCSVKKADVIAVPDASVNTEDVLANKLPMDAETHQGVLALMKTVPSLANAPKTSESRKFEEFLRSDSPPLELPELEMLPIFPRSEPLGERSGCTPIVDSMSRLPESILSSVKMREEDEEDLAEEHLVVVNGWQALRTSSPSTPSLADSSSEVDELFLPSSPGLEFFCADRLRMEVPQVPRSERIGGARGKRAVPGQENKLSDFLPPLVRPAPNLGPRIVHSPKSQPSSPRTSITLSMLGQPPSAPDFPEAIPGISSVDTDPSSDDSVTFAVKTVERACGDRLGSEDLAHYILQEKLDEKDGMLMDVPPMRSPNEHHIDRCILPIRMADLLAPMKTGPRHPEAQAEGPSSLKRFSGYLKKVKGLQPLQIELSWIPFKYGRTVPTDEEVADVQNDPCPQLAKSIDMAQDEIVSRLAGLLDESMAFGSQPVSVESAPSSMVWLSDPQDVEGNAGRSSFGDEQALILPRQDRRCLAGLPPLSSDYGASDSDGQASGTMSSPETLGVFEAPPVDVKDARNEDERPAKRVRFQDPVYEELATEYYPHVDDSGVFFYGDNGDTRCTFGQLAYDSEGFEGPNADGDLFQDVHPLHSGDYRFDYAPDPYLQGFRPPYGLDTDVLSPLHSDCKILDGDGRPVEELEGAAARPPFHQLATHDGRALFTPALASLPAPLCSPAAVLSTLTDRQPAPAASVPSVSSGVQGSRTGPEPSVATAGHSLSDFLAICGKGSLAASCDIARAPASISEQLRSSEGVLEVQLAPSASAYRAKEAPPELIDDRTLVLPARHMSPSIRHLYMASLELIQKRSLVRALASVYATDLVEREHLGPDAENVQLILDCDTAVLFTSVESLPSRVNAVVASLTTLSWRFSRLLLVFECYPSSWNYRGDQDYADKPTASAWSPAVVKAVKKLRRDLTIAEGMQTKRAATLIEYAFANTARESALFTRMYGDAAAARDETCGALWGEREWLTHEERDGECDLGGVDGMNIFVASLLLSQTTLEDFLEKSADDRLLEFADLAGMERMTRFNVEMARRLEAMQLPPSSPIVIDTSSSSRDVGDSDLDMY